MSRENTPAEAWPENPDAGWLGTWASRNEHLIPREFNLRIVREIYHEERQSALAEGRTPSST